MAEINTTYLLRVADFLNGLAELSREHGVYLWAPSTQPLLTDRAGQQIGHLGLSDYDHAAEEYVAMYVGE